MWFAGVEKQGTAETPMDKPLASVCLWECCLAVF